MFRNALCAILFLLLAELNLSSATANQALSKNYLNSIAEELNISTKQAEHLISIVFKQLVIELEQDQIIQIPGFGSFYLQHRAERKMKHYKSGRSYKIPARRYPKYRSSQILKNQLNPM